MTPSSSLLQWLSTFQLDGHMPAVELNKDAYYNLADGYVCARILNQISPVYFTDQWLDGIKPVPPNGSWRLRVSNLKRILQKIHDYACDLQSHQFKPSAINPDVTVIAQNFDPDQINRLIQLILFCAINCDKKQDYIEKIRDLPTQVKQDIKEAIEELLVRNDESQQFLATKESRAQEYHELEIKLKQMKLERDQLAYENERLLAQTEKGQVHEFLRRSSTASSREILENRGTSRLDADSPSEDLAQQQSKRLQDEVKRLKEEIIRIESEKEDFRLKSNLLKEDLDRITLRHEDMRSKAEQAKRLQDELDEHKHISGKVVSYEQMIENLVKKNNEMKKDLKSLEEKNLTHVQNIVRLEQDNQKLTSGIKQVDIYRKQLNEVQLKLSEETHRADKAEVELARLSEKFTATRRENEKLFEATNQLIFNSSASKDQQAMAETLGQHVDLKESRARLEIESTPNDMLNSMSTANMELKEKIARLEMENQLLEKRLNTRPENNKSVLGGLLEESAEKCKKLEGENRQAKKKIIMLESKLKDLVGTQNSSQPSTSGVQDFGIQDTSSDNVLGLIKRVEELQQSLCQKDQELREAEAKYRKNIQKARDVMKALNSNGGPGISLHPSCMSSTSSFNSSSPDEVNILRQQLRDRDERLIALEREFYEFKKFKEVHERLILSAFYGLTTTMQWRNADKRLQQTTLTSPPNTANSSISNHFSPGKQSH